MADWPAYQKDVQDEIQPILTDSSFFGLTLNELNCTDCKLHDVDFRDGDFANSTLTNCDFSNSLFMNKLV